MIASSSSCYLYNNSFHLLTTCLFFFQAINGDEFYCDQSCQDHMVSYPDMPTGCSLSGRQFSHSNIHSSVKCEYSNIIDILVL